MKTIRDLFEGNSKPRTIRDLFDEQKPIRSWADVAQAEKPQQAEPKEESNMLLDALDVATQFNPARVAYDIMNSPVTKLLGGTIAETAGNALQAISDPDRTLAAQYNPNLQKLRGAGDKAQELADKWLKEGLSEVEPADSDTYSGALKNAFQGGAYGVLQGDASMIHSDKSANALQQAIQQLQDENPVDAELSWEYLTSPHGMTRDFGNVTGSMAAILPAMLAMPESVAARGAAKLGGDALTRYLINQGRYGVAKQFARRAPEIFRYGATSPWAEGLAEGGHVREENLAQGLSDDEATRNSIEAMLANVPLLTASNTLEGFLLGAPNPAKNMFRKATQAAIRGGINMEQQGTEEALQKAISNAQTGKDYGIAPWNWTPDQWQEHNMAVGGTAPMAFMAGAGHMVSRPNANADNWQQGSQEDISNEGYSNRARKQSRQNQYDNLRAWSKEISNGKMSDEVFDSIVRNAKMQGVPIKIALAQATAESNGNQDVTSEAGAIGVMQLIPETAKGLGVDPYDQEQNIRGGMKYLKDMYDQFGDWNLALAAYNAGPGAVQKFGGIPNYSETQNYVAKINGYLNESPYYEAAGDDAIRSKDSTYLGDNGKGEGNTWQRQHDGVSFEGAQPQLLNAIDVLGKWFYDRTGKRLVVTAGTNGKHADGEHSHAAGWKVDVNDWDGVSDGYLVTADGSKGTLTDEFIKFGQSLGLGMNWEGDHIDVALDGTQWDGSTETTNFGGFNPRGVNRTPAQPAEQKPQSEQTQVAEAKPLFDINSEDDRTQKLFEPFATERLLTAAESNNSEEFDFFNGMFDSKNEFKNTKEIRDAIREKYSDDFTAFAENAMPKEQPKAEEKPQQAPQLPLQTQPQQPKQEKQRVKAIDSRSENPLLRNENLRDAAINYLTSIDRNAPENAGFALQLDKAISKNDTATIKQMLESRGAPTIPTQPDPVTKNEAPENILPTKAKLTEQEKLIRTALAIVPTGKDKVKARKKQGDALIRLANQNNIEIPAAEVIALQNGSTKIVQKWRDEIFRAGFFKVAIQPQPEAKPQPEAQPQPESSQSQQEESTAAKVLKARKARANLLHKVAKLGNNLSSMFGADENYSSYTAPESPNQNENRLEPWEDLSELSREHDITGTAYEKELQRRQAEEEEYRQWKAKQDRELEQLQARQAENKRLAEKRREMDAQRIAQQEAEENQQRVENVQNALGIQDATLKDQIEFALSEPSSNKSEREKQGRLLTTLLEYPQVKYAANDNRIINSLKPSLKVGGKPAILKAQEILNSIEAPAQRERRYDEKERFPKSQAQIESEQRARKQKSQQRQYVREQRLEEAEFQKELAQEDAIEKANFEDELDFEDELFESKMEARNRYTTELENLFDQEEKDNERRAERLRADTRAAQAEEEAWQAEEQYRQKLKAQSQRAGEYARQKLAGNQSESVQERRRQARIEQDDFETEWQIEDELNESKLWRQGDLEYAFDSLPESEEHTPPVDSPKWNQPISSIRVFANRNVPASRLKTIWDYVQSHDKPEDFQAFEAAMKKTYPDFSVNFSRGEVRINLDKDPVLEYPLTQSAFSPEAVKVELERYKKSPYTKEHAQRVLDSRDLPSSVYEVRDLMDDVEQAERQTQSAHKPEEKTATQAEPIKKNNAKKNSLQEKLHAALKTDTHSNLKAWLEAKIHEAATPEGKKARAYLEELLKQDLNDTALDNAERTLEEQTKFFDDHVRSIESSSDITAQQKQQAILARKNQLDENRGRLNFRHPSSKFDELNQKISQMSDKELQTKAKGILERGWDVSWDKQQKSVEEIEDLIQRDESLPTQGEPISTGTQPNEQVPTQKSKKMSPKAKALYEKFKTDTYPNIKKYLDDLFQKAAGKEKTPERTAAKEEIKKYESMNVTDEMLKRAEVMVFMRSWGNGDGTYEPIHATAVQILNAQVEGKISSEKAMQQLEELKKLEPELQAEYDEIRVKERDPEYGRKNISSWGLSKKHKADLRKKFLEGETNQQPKDKVEAPQGEENRPETSTKAEEPVTTESEQNPTEAEQKGKASDEARAEFVESFSDIDSQDRPFWGARIKTSRFPLGSLSDEAVEKLNKLAKQYGSLDDVIHTSEYRLARFGTAKARDGFVKAIEDDGFLKMEYARQKQKSYVAEDEKTRVEKIISSAKEKAYKILEADKYPEVKEWLDGQVENGIRQKKIDNIEAAEDFAKRIVSTVKSFREGKYYPRGVLGYMAQNWQEQRKKDSRGRLSKADSEKYSTAIDIIDQAVDGKLSLEDAYTEMKNLIGGKRGSTRKSKGKWHTIGSAGSREALQAYMKENGMTVEIKEDGTLVNSKGEEFHDKIRIQKGRWQYGYYESEGAKHSKRGDVDTRIKKLVEDKDLTPQQKLLQSFGKKLGVKTVFFEGDENFHGKFENGVTYLNVNSNMPIAKVFWHESMHWLKNNNPKLYQALVKAAGITDAQRQAFLKETGRTDLTTNEEIDEEILADAMEDVAKRTGLLQSISGKNRGLIERVVQWLKDTMNKFIDTFRNPQGKLTTEQATRLADEFGKIANGLVDSNSEKIFRYNRRTHNVELADGRELTAVNEERPEEREVLTLEAKYSIDASDNSDESTLQRIRNKISAFIGSSDQTSARRNKRIAQYLQKLADIRIVAGHIKGAKAIEVDEFHRLLKSKKYADWENILPEIGGMLAKSLNLQDSPEMRNYFTDWLLTGAPNNNSAEAKAFQQAARNNQPMFEILQKIRDEFQEVAELSPEEWYSGKIIDKPQDKTVMERLGYFKENWREEIIDDLHPIERMFDEALAKADKTNPQLAKWLRESVNPYEMARLLRGKGAAAEIMIGNVGTSPSKRINEIREALSATYPNINFSNFKPIAMILEGIGGLKDKKAQKTFESFCMAKLDKEMYEKKREDPDKYKYLQPLGTESQADAVIQKYEKQFGQAQKDLVHYSNTMLTIMYDAGVLTKNKYYEILNSWKNYIPTARVFDENEEYDFADSFKQKTGSNRDVWSPISKLDANTHSFIKQAERNKVKCQIASLARCGQFGQIIAETDNPHPNTDTCVSFYEYGKKHWLETPDTSIVRALNAIQSQKDGAWIVKAFNAVMSWFKGFQTFWNPDFSAGNIFRDSAAAYVHNKALGYSNPFMYFADIARIGLKGFWTKDANWLEWQAFGGSQAAFVSQDVDYVQRSVSDITESGFESFKKHPLSYILDKLQYIAEASETATRLTTYVKARDALAARRSDGKATIDDKHRAALMSRNASIDFAKAGTSTRKANRVFAFANAAVQDFALQAETFSPTKVQKAIKGDKQAQKEIFSAGFRLMLMGVIPTLIQFALMHRDDDKKKIYRDLHDWEKETYWYLGDTLRIPKSMDIGIRMTSAITDEFLKTAIDKDPAEWRRFRRLILDAAPGLTATIATPLIESYANYSLFRDAPIVPAKEQHLPGRLQYGNETSPVAKLISDNTLTIAKIFGNETGFSPRKIDYLISSYLGFMGRFFSGGTDELPMVRRFAFDPYRNPKIVKDYYEALDKQTDLYNGYKLELQQGKKVKRPEDYDPMLHARLKSVQKTMRNLSNLEKRILDDPELSSDQRTEKLHELEKRRIVLCERALNKAR